MVRDKYGGRLSSEFSWTWQISLKREAVSLCLLSWCNSVHELCSLVAHTNYAPCPRWLPDSYGVAVVVQYRQTCNWMAVGSNPEEAQMDVVGQHWRTGFFLLLQVVGRIRDYRLEPCQGRSRPGEFHSWCPYCRSLVPHWCREIFIYLSHLASNNILISNIIIYNIKQPQLSYQYLSL